MTTDSHPSGLPFGPAERFLERRRLRSAYLGDHLSEAELVVITPEPTSVTGCLDGAGVDGLMASTGLPALRTSLREVANRRAAGDVLVVPGPEVLGLSDAETAVSFLGPATKTFDRILLVGWRCWEPTARTASFLGSDGVEVTVPDERSYGALKNIGRVELDLDPSIYCSAFGESLRDPSWIDRFDGKVDESRQSREHVVLTGEDLRSDEPRVRLHRLLTRISAADRIVADRWATVLSAILLGTSVEYVDDSTEEITSALHLHFGGDHGALAARLEEPLETNRTGRST